MASSNKLAAVLSSLTRASSEKLDKVIATLEEQKPSVSTGALLYNHNSREYILSMV